MGKDVKVSFVGVDKVTAIARGALKGVKDLVESGTKIAAGIGIADGFKEIGRGIKDAIAEAAAAYPKLAAPFVKLKDTFSELKIQAGAAFLEALKPALPLLQALLDWSVKLAKQLPDAIDGAQISFAQFTGGLKQIPDIGRQVFGSLLSTIADAARAAAPYLDALLGANFVGIADRISAAGAGMSQAGIRGRRATNAATASTVSGIAGRVHNFGPRAAPDGASGGGFNADNTLAEVEAARRRDAERILREDAKNHRARGGPRFAGPDLSNPDSVLTNLAGATQLPVPDVAAWSDFGEAMKGVLDPLGQVNAASMTLNETLGTLAGSTLATFGDAWGNVFATMAQGGDVIGRLEKALVQAAAGAAVKQGKLFIAEGVAKVGAGLFPPNPAMIASGLKEIAGGTALAALGSTLGGGGGSSVSLSAGGSGSLSGSSASQTGGVATSRDRTVVQLQKGYVSTTDPDFQELIIGLVNNGIQRGVPVEIQYTGVGG